MQTIILQTAYSPTLFNYAAWIVISLCYGASAVGVFRLSHFLGNILQSVLYTLGTISAVHSLLGLLNASIGLIYLVWFNMDGRIIWLTDLRLIQNIIFAATVAVFVNAMVHRANRLAPPQQSTVREAARAFGRLQAVLDQSK